MNNNLVYNLGLHSDKALKSISSMLDFAKAWVRQREGNHANTRKFVSVKECIAKLNQTGEIQLVWGSQYKDNTWGQERFLRKMGNYPMDQRLFAIAVQLKAWIMACAKEQGVNILFQSPSINDTLTFSGNTINIYEARFWYEKFLGRSSLCNHFSKDFLDEMKGSPMDPIKMQMIEMVVQSLKDAMAKKSEDIKALRRQCNQEQRDIGKKFEALMDERRERGKAEYAEIVERIHALCPGYYVGSIDELSPSEW